MTNRAPPVHSGLRPAHRQRPVAGPEPDGAESARLKGPDDRAIPVLVNHNQDRKIGARSMTSMSPRTWSAGRDVRDFYFASVELDDPPGWLKVGECSILGTHGVADAGRQRYDRLLREPHPRSRLILPPSVAPAEAARTSGPPHAPSLAGGGRYWRSRPAAGENILNPTGAVLRRPGIGQVLGNR